MMEKYIISKLKKNKFICRKKKLFVFVNVETDPRLQLRACVSWSQGGPNSGNACS